MDSATLRKLYGPPSERASQKILPYLDKHSIKFIENSSFLILGTSNNKSLDLSPKGDPKGFIKIIDKNTIELPDRPGNNRIDGLLNILVNPKVAILFFIPNVNETLRLQGIAEILTDKKTLNMHKIRNRLPKTVTRIKIEAVGLHCGKALIRSSLWQPENWPKKRPLESLYNILEDQTGLKSLATDEEQVNKIYKKSLY